MKQKYQDNSDSIENFINNKAIKMYQEKHLYEKKAERILYFTSRIKKNKEWLNKIKTQAIKEGISLDKAIDRNARYMVRKEMGIN